MLQEVEAKANLEATKERNEMYEKMRKSKQTRLFE